MYKYDVYKKPIVVYEKHRVMYEKHRVMYEKKHCYIVLKIVICLIKLFEFSKICLICFDVYGKKRNLMHLHGSGGALFPCLGRSLHVNEELYKQDYIEPAIEPGLWPVAF
jgi:hypothetical protein